MQQIKRLTPFIAVSGQLEPADMRALATSGYHCVINNRPDNEGEGQPASTAMRTAAEAAGLEYHDLPVVSGKITDADIAAFSELLDRVRGPVLAFCRTGTRSTILWALAEAHHLDPEALLAAAREAGYDLSAQQPRLEQRWQALSRAFTQEKK
jgi:sulfide:quinone oxidoreductase